jgi:hypothetical protein
MGKPLETSYWEVLFLRFHIVFARLYPLIFTKFNKKNGNGKENVIPSCFVINYSKK